MKPSHYFLLLSVGAIWGAHFILNEVIIRSIPPITTAAVRAVLGAVTLTLILRFTQPQKDGGSDFQHLQLRLLWKQLFIVGIFEATLPFFLMAWGQQYTSSGLASILMSTTPIFTTILARFLIPGARLTLANLLGILLGCSGVIVLVGSISSLGSWNTILGKFAILFAAFSFALALILIKQMPSDSPVRSARDLLLFASLQLIPISLLVDRPWLLNPTGESILAVFISGIACAGIAYALYFILIEQKGPTIASFTSYLVPLFGTVFGVVCLGEVITASTVVAFLLIIAAIAVNGFDGVNA